MRAIFVITIGKMGATNQRLDFWCNIVFGIVIFRVVSNSCHVANVAVQVYNTSLYIAPEWNSSYPGREGGMVTCVCTNVCFTASYVSTDFNSFYPEDGFYQLRSDVSELRSSYALTIGRLHWNYGRLKFIKPCNRIGLYLVILLSH